MTSARTFGMAFALLLSFPPAASLAEIERITVTATKRAENLNDVPLTVQAISGDELQALRADTAEDVLSLFANLSANGSNEVNKGFSIRGVGTNNFHGNVNHAVGVYLDEVSISTPFSGTLGLFDVERAEVLRGPQNTLFGRNTTGGAINFISRLPSVEDGVNGYAQLTLGEDAEANLEGAVGLPLGDSVAARLAVQSINRDGLFVNRAPGRDGERLGERDRQAARLQLLWAADPATDVLVNAHVGYSRGTNIGNKAVGIRDPADANQPCDIAEIVAGSDYQSRNECVAANGFNPSTSDWASVYNVSGAQADIDIDGGFVRIDHAFAGGSSLTSITAIENTRINQADDTGGYNVIRLTPTQDGDYEQFSQELRIASPDDRMLRWMAGLYYYAEDMSLGTHVVNGAAGVIASNILEQEDVDRSIYAQLDYDVSERFTIGAGLRYTDNDKKAPSSIFRVVPRGPNGLTDPALLITNDIVENASVVPVTIPFSDLEANIDEVTGRLYASFQASDDVLLYLSYAEGFKSGGFDTRAIAAVTPGANVGQPVGPEFLDAWEIGVKSTLANGRVQLNASAFLYEWDGLQTFIVIGGVPGFGNIPESQLHGMEIEATWIPADGWLVDANLGFLDTQVTEVGNLSASVDRGHELTNAPDVTARVAVQKSIELQRGQLDLRADLHYSDAQKDTFLFARDAFSTKDSVRFADAYVAYTFGADNRFDVRLWGENLTEERTCFDIGLVDNPAVTTRQLTSTGACSPSDGQRRFGVTGRWRF